MIKGDKGRENVSGWDRSGLAGAGGGILGVGLDWERPKFVGEVSD